MAKERDYHKEDLQKQKQKEKDEKSVDELEQEKTDKENQKMIANGSVVVGGASVAYGAMTGNQMTEVGGVLAIGRGLSRRKMLADDIEDLDQEIAKQQSNEDEQEDDMPVRHSHRKSNNSGKKQSHWI